MTKRNSELLLLGAVGHIPQKKQWKFYLTAKLKIEKLIAFFAMLC
jgi:hypothetical protein